MAAGSGARCAGIIAVAGVLAAQMLPASSALMPGASPRYGERLVAEYQLPAATLARIAAFTPSAPLAGESPRVNSMAADKVEWAAPPQRAGAGRNPYTLVLTVSGVARAAGDVASLWHTGWEVQESADTVRQVFSPVRAIARAGVAAGTPLTLHAASGPVSFRGEREVTAVVGLVHARNLDIDDVRVQVWSGTAPIAWRETLLSRAGLTGFAALCFLFWMLRTIPPRVRQASSVRHASVTEQPRIAPAAVTAAAAPPPPDHGLRVFAALREVLAPQR